MSIAGTPSTPVRIDQLTPYIQGSPGDSDYIDPAQIIVPVGHVEFLPEKAKGVSLAQLLASNSSSLDCDRVTGLASRTFTVTFTGVYQTIPVTTKLEVYRMYNIPGTSEWIKEEVSYYYPSENWLTLTGFTIVIRAEESLTGVIVEYKIN